MAMKNPYEVLRAKEREIEVVKQQIEALRITARLLGDEPEDDDLVLEQRTAGKAVRLP
jgi:hypothetical protein